MDSNTYTSILKTICYADIFDFPLTEEEVFIWLTSLNTKKKIKRKELIDQIRLANGVIKHKDNLLFLKGRGSLLRIRKNREAIAKKKLVIAKKVASILCHIPTITLIGVSGSVAIENAKEHDDIDIFIVTKAHTIWLTRLITTVVADLFAKRRKPGSLSLTNAICFNMFVDEYHLAIPKEKQNLYVAHEVCQLKVLYNKNNTYERFLTANAWSKKFLPNATSLQKPQQKIQNSSFSFSYLLLPLEKIAKFFQLWYMHKRYTTETVSDHVLAFHPKDYTPHILTAFERKLKLYGAYV